MSKNNKYLIKYNPLTPSLRHTCLVNKRYLNNNYKLNNLLVSINKVSG